MIGTERKVIPRVEREEIRYRISADGRIDSIEGPWDRFARENGAPSLPRPVGEPLLDHVAGASVRAVLASLLDRARRLDEPMELSYRCDAPDRRRFMRLRLEPEVGGTLMIRSRVLREEPRPPVRLLEPDAPRSDELLKICAWCKRVEVEGAWVEVEEAVELLALFDRPNVPDLTHGVCDACSRELESAG